MCRGVAASALRRARCLALALVLSLAFLLLAFLVGPSGLGLLRAAIQRHQDRQRPGTGGEGELDQDRQDDPFVPPAIGGEGVGRAHRIAMAALAVDLGAAMLVDGIVAGQEDGAVGDVMVEDELRQEACQRQRGPASFREDAVIAGGISRSQAGHGAEEVGDGASSGGQDRRDEQDEEALVGGLEEDGGERVEHRPCEGWYKILSPELLRKMRRSFWTVTANYAASSVQVG